MSKEAFLPILFDLFRQYGYDGVSLSRISQVTQLSRASLYHHFPGGKAEMLDMALGYSERWFEQNVVKTLQTNGSATEKMQAMCDCLSRRYEGGAQPCLLATLTTGTQYPQVQEIVGKRIERFVSAIALLLVDAGMVEQDAQQRAEDAMIILQGAIVLSRALGNTSIFERAIAALPQKLCESVPD